MRVIGSLLIALFATGLVACNDDNPVTATSEKRPEPTPLKAAVVYTYFNDDPLTRFAVKFTNPGDSVRVGATATWKALDADGTIVGTFDTSLPPIKAGGSHVYVGGAGAANLTGTPAQVTIEINDEGRMADAAPDPSLGVGQTEFKRFDFDVYPGAETYEATVVVSALKDVETAKMHTAILLRDASGKIVGATWADLHSAPATLAAGEKAKLSAFVPVQGGEPKTAEAVAQ